MSDRLAAALAELVAALRDEARGAAPETNAPDRLLSIPDACAALGGIGRTALYGELAAGRLGSLTVGRRRFVPAAAIADYIASRSERP
jgi:hypothetical protein